MIFVTIGSMFPFDRLIQACDGWAAGIGGPERVFAQIGEGSYVPQHMSWVRRLDQDAFAAKVREAEFVVAHAGMGSVIMAGQYGKRIVLLPRRHDLGEHTTDHQMATARWLQSRPGIGVALDEMALIETLARTLSDDSHTPDAIPAAAPQEFLDRVRACLLV